MSSSTMSFLKRTFQKLLGSFSYQPLNKTDHEIRVLHVAKPASAADPISCSIHHVSLDSKPVPEYETISYTWGDPNPCSLIILDGYSFRVPVNTERALRRAATSEQPRTIWIDAVCINQADIEERAQQVALMKKVFSLCKRVVAYLGESDETTHRALHNLAQIYQEVKEEVGEQRTLRKMIQREDGNWIRATTPIRCVIDEEALATFFARPWFSRLWVVQEIALPPKSICLCGEFEVSLHETLDCAAFLETYHNLHVPQEITEKLYSGTTMWAIADRYSQSGSVDMANLLIRGRGLQASDARDKVFGVLGLHLPENSHVAQVMLAPDYHKSAKEVLRDAVRYCIVTRYDSLYLLRSVSHRSEEELQSDGYPSWVPRLDRPWSDEFDSISLQRHGPPDFRIDRKLVEPTIDSDLLRLQGHLLDTLAAVSPAHNRELRNIGNESNLLAWLNTAMNIASEVVGADDLSLSRILVADHNHLQQRSKSSQYQDDYSAFYTYLKLHGYPGQPDKLPYDASDEHRQASYYWSSFARVTLWRKIFRTRDNSFLGLGPKLSQPGDIVVIFDGNEVPSVLRPMGDHYLFLGSCYVDGAMYWQEEFPALKEKLDVKGKQIFGLR